MGGCSTFVSIPIAFGFSVGSQILIARRNGEGNYQSRSHYVAGNGFQFRYGSLFVDTDVFFCCPLIRLLLLRILLRATYEFSPGVSGDSFAFVNVMFRGLYIGITRTKVLTMNAVVMALVNVVPVTPWYSEN